jgi:hypothetical protein
MSKFSESDVKGQGVFGMYKYALIGVSFVHLINCKLALFGPCSSHSRGAVTRAMNMLIGPKDER